MKTVSIAVQNLCIPCENRCRYCLLSWDGRLRGADYRRSADYAKRFHDWICLNRPDLSFQFYFGYSMEHPQLFEAVDFMAGLGSAGGKFLQMDGLRFRSAEEIDSLLSGLQAHSVRLLGLTFYGTQAYHDRFAARKGDYAYLHAILERAKKIGLACDAAVPLTHENASQAVALLSELQPLSGRVSFFVPHSEGRGASLEPIRFSAVDFSRLSESVRQRFNSDRFKTEREWLAALPPEPEKRMLAISLTDENIAFFERMSFPEAIAWLERLDDEYYAAVPSMKSLAQTYGNPDGDRFYSARDLYLCYQRRFLRDSGVNIHDMNDERQCFSRRF